MEQPPVKKTTQSKESFSAYVTRVTGIATAISLGGLFLGLPDTLVGVAKMVATYSVVTWTALVGVPMAVKYGWKNHKKIKDTVQEMRSKGGMVVQSVGEVVKNAIPENQDNGSQDEQAHNTDRMEQSSKIGYQDLPEPFSYLPVNPVPIPRGALTKESAPDFVRNTIQMAGLNMDDNPEILMINSGPTLQSITFQLPRGMQLSTLIKRREDLANHTGLTTGFSVEAGDAASSATFVVPQTHRAFVYMRDVAPGFIQFAETARLPVIFGKDTKGDPIYIDLVKLPHLLVAGSTNSGKSVFINTIIESITSVRSPDQAKFLLIDPKMVEFNVYNGMPHLLHPTVTDPKRASLALQKLCVEMDIRYEKLAQVGARNIEQYNKAYPNEAMIYIVAVIDEYADVILVAKGDVEDAVSRIAAKARACGIHLILGTQRPSADVVTGVIKANLPSRVAFKLNTSHDYRTVLEGGSRSLLGKGDGICMLDDGRLIRFQSAAISGDDEEMIEYIQETKKYWIGRAKAVKSVSSTQVVSWSSTDLDTEEMEHSYRPEIMQSENIPDVLEVDDDQVSLKTEIVPIQDDSTEDTVEGGQDHPKDHIEINDWETTFNLDEDIDRMSSYDRFVALVQRFGGWRMSEVTEHMNIEMPEHVKYVERMVRDGLLGEFDHGLRMRPWVGDHSDEEESSLSDESDLMEKTKEYICRMRSTRTSEIREYLRVRKEKVLKIMQLLAEEGLLERPTHANSGYTISWSEEQIDAYLQELDTE